MNKRPISVLVIGWLYVAVGALAVSFHLAEMKPRPAFESDVLWAVLVNLVAIVCGVYVLRGRNWARWLAVAWMAGHVILSVFHSWSEVVVHSLFCAAIAYFLFRPPATQYFRP
jgi:uncharacterized membrane protein YgdD (TMEM256/DUF423 family)